eukprot:scaffold188233_cov63-Attheya_sp.AAC.1
MAYENAARMVSLEGLPLAVVVNRVIPEFRDHMRALEAYQLAADIGYDVRGSGNVEHAKDLWQVTGSSMANNDTTRCRNALKNIWAMEFSFFMPRRCQKGILGSEIYAMPWWHDCEDYHKLHVMMSIAKESCEINSSVGKSSNQGKKKKDRKFK